jgi:hypothetical protein
MLTYFSSPYHSHLHPPALTRNIDVESAATQPGALPADLPGPLEPMSVEMINQVGASDRQARKDRLEAESRGWDSVFSQ